MRKGTLPMRSVFFDMADIDLGSILPLYMT